MSDSAARITKAVKTLNAEVESMRLTVHESIGRINAQIAEKEPSITETLFVLARDISELKESVKAIESRLRLESCR